MLLAATSLGPRPCCDGVPDYIEPFADAAPYGLDLPGLTRWARDLADSVEEARRTPIPPRPRRSSELGELVGELVGDPGDDVSAVRRVVEELDLAGLVDLAEQVTT